MQVGREVAADEAANNGRGKREAKQSNSDVCHCDNLIFVAFKVI